MKAESAIGLVTIPKTVRFPYSINVGALLGRQNLAVNPWHLTWKVKDDTGIHTGHEKVIRTELYDHCGTVSILCAGSAPPILLRKTEGNRSLPCAKIKFLTRLARLLHGGLQLAFKLRLRNHAVNGLNERKVPGVRCPRLIAEDVPSRFIHTER